MNGENKRKHLEMIQAVINRMASNSFLLKGWSVTLVAALLAITVIKSQIALLPVISFWLLDGFFLHQERLYRKLYNAVRVKDEVDIDFSMNAEPFTGAVDNWLKVTFSIKSSKTLPLFHGTIFIVVVIIAVINYFCS